MHDTSMWELVKNSPEWVTVLTSALFAIVTVGVIIWQVCVMKAQVRVMVWQAKNSAHHERTQNRLIESQNKLFRSQIEHEWLVSINAERERLLTLGRKLYVAANVVWHSAPNSAELTWNEVRETVFELNDRLNVLNIAVYSGLYDMWYSKLREYRDAVLKAVTAEQNQFPSPYTKSRLGDANAKCLSDSIFIEIEDAIASDFRDFKNKWDAAHT